MTASRSPIASLAMYDGGELTAANDALWQNIAERLRAVGLSGVPQALERERELEEVWASDALVFGQTCGYPFAARLQGRLRLLATPEYDAPGCTPDGHRSFVIVHVRSPRSSEDGLETLRGSRAVINDVESMTGRHLLGDAIAAAGGGSDFFTSVEVRGSHARSLEAVATGAADVAAIDCVSYAHLARSAPEVVAETRIIHRTRVTPSLPFVLSAALGADAERAVARALADAVADPQLEDARRVLRLVGLRRTSPALYQGTLATASRADGVLLSQVCRIAAERVERKPHPGA